MSKKTIAVLLAVLISAGILLWWLSPSADTVSSDFLPIEDVHGSDFAGLTNALWYERASDQSVLQTTLASSSSDVYVAARRSGRRMAHVWRAQGSSFEALKSAIVAVKKELGNSRAIDAVDTLEVVFAFNHSEVSRRDRSWSSNIYRGVRGFEIQYGDQVERYSPTYMLATNRDVYRLITLFQVRNRLKAADMWSERTRYRYFEADQWLVKLADEANQSPEAIRMERGNAFVPLSSVDQDTTGLTARLATEWLSNNLHEDGRMTYKYWPSARKESDANNMIRQWMATVALVRSAKHWQDDRLMQRATENIDYNLNNFFHEESGYGLIEWQGKVKLGAVALAALALAEHPDRQRWQAQEIAMQRTIDYLWQEGGAFRTFYKPANRNDVQNFYPGEALLYWATLYEQKPDEKLLKKINASFQYYRDWHLKPSNRNPAFIPWHTQAYYKVWKLTGNAAMKDFVFQMNDWLVDQMQQWEGEVRYRDTLGRFYNPQKRYGPPHVSSTGVYLEGLIDAFEMARITGDEARRALYRTAIRRGLRSVMQLQFVDDVDMFYVPVLLRSKVRGGMRTTVYNNEIRCDNVQHNLMGMLKILEAFESADYLVN